VELLGYKQLPIIEKQEDIPCRFPAADPTAFFFGKVPVCRDHSPSRFLYFFAGNGGQLRISADNKHFR